MYQPIEKNKSLTVIPVTPSIFMKKADWQKWDAALRSGEYEQGRMQLKTDEGSYCCLGVLQQCLTGEVESNVFPSLKWLDKHDISFGAEPGRPVTEMTGRYPFMHEVDDIISALNDGTDIVKSLDFLQIADLIKRAVSFTDKE